MDSQKTLLYTMGIVAVILGITLVRQFDFATYRFDHTPMAMVYVVGLAIALYAIINHLRNKSDS